MSLCMVLSSTKADVTVPSVGDVSVEEASVAAVVAAIAKALHGAMANRELRKSIVGLFI